MANLEVARKENDEEILEVVAIACSVARYACAILDEQRHPDIDIEMPGWPARVAVPSPGRPGSVRGAVEKVLSDFGLER